MSEERVDQPIVAEAVQPILQVNWEAIQSKRQELVATLEQMAANFPKEGKKRLNLLISWFSHPRDFEEALVRADVLAVCVPLCKSLQLNGELVESDLATAVRVGFCSVGQNTAASRQLLKAFAYPAIVLLAAAMVAIFFSVFVVPEFEKMFREFEIELPAMTEFVFEFANSIRSWSFFFLTWITLTIGIVWYLNRISAPRRPDGLGWLDLWMKSSRDALADWAWHISLLLESGLPQNLAIPQACRFAGKSWLRENSRFWVQVESENSPSGAVPLQPGLRPMRYLTNPKYQLLDYALTVPNTEGKIRLLREVAMCYRDRNRNIGLWWIEWLVAFMLWGIGVVILILVVSLFSPLIAIISSLTGA